MYEIFSLSSGIGKYHKVGNGSPIVLIHGFAETYEIWKNIVPTLAKNYLLIIPEIPGCGNSEKFDNIFSMEKIADFVNEILEQECIEKTVLFGHSMGGYAAAAFAQKYNDKLIGLSFVHSSAQADSEEKKKVRQVAIDFVENKGKDDFLKTLIPKLYASPEHFVEERKMHLKMAEQYSAKQIIACYTAMMDRADHLGILPTLSFPIQFIAGKEDSSINYRDVEKQAALCKQHRLDIFDDIGHSSMHENPKILRAAINGFLDDIFLKSWS